MMIVRDLLENETDYTNFDDFVIIGIDAKNFQDKIFKMMNDCQYENMTCKDFKEYIFNIIANADEDNNDKDNNDKDNNNTNNINNTSNDVNVKNFLYIFSLSFYDTSKKFNMAKRFFTKENRYHNKKLISNTNRKNKVNIILYSTDINDNKFLENFLSSDMIKYKYIFDKETNRVKLKIYCWI